MRRGSSAGPFWVFTAMTSRRSWGTLKLPEVVIFDLLPDLPQAQARYLIHRVCQSHRTETHCHMNGLLLVHDPVAAYKCMLQFTVRTQP